MMCDSCIGYEEDPDNPDFCLCGHELAEHGEDEMCEVNW